MRDYLYKKTYTGTTLLSSFHRFHFRILFLLDKLGLLQILHCYLRQIHCTLFGFFCIVMHATDTAIFLRPGLSFSSLGFNFFLIGLILAERVKRDFFIHRDLKLIFYGPIFFFRTGSDPLGFDSVLK